MRHVSYLFAGYIYDKRRFSVGFIRDAWANTEPTVPGERLVQIAVSPRVEAVFYLGNQSSGKLIEFGYGCEALIRDGYADAPARQRLAEGQRDFQYAVWAASETSDFDASICFTGETIEARAMVRGQAERIVKERDTVNHYELVKLAQSPQELGMLVDASVEFDEEDYQRRLTELEEPFRPGLLVHDEIGVPRGKVMDAHSHALSGSGTVIWPKEGPVDTPELRRALRAMADPQIPTLPLWAHWTNEAGVTSSGRTVLPRRRRKS